jgi:ribose-phosphate pyrophosphokinase
MHLLFSPNESRPFAQEVCALSGVPLAALEEREFEGGEFKLRPLESVRDRTVFVLQSLAGHAALSASDRLVRLLFLAKGLRDAGARQLIVLVPYLAFARKDRRTKPRDPVTQRYVAELLEATGATRAVALDVHNDAAFDNAFRIPTDHLTAGPLLVDHFAKRDFNGKLVVASPDIGGVKRAQIFSELLAARTRSEIDLVFLEKRRSSGTVSSGMLVGDVAGRHVIMLDDLCATGGTLIRGAQACKEAGAVAVHAVVTHAPMPAGLQAIVDAPAIDSVSTTDSVGLGFHPARLAANPKLTILPASALFGEAVRRMSQGLPLAPLLTHWPVT